MRISNHTTLKPFIEKIYFGGKTFNIHAEGLEDKLEKGDKTEIETTALCLLGCIRQEELRAKSNDLK